MHRGSSHPHGQPMGDAGAVLTPHGYAQADVVRLKEQLAFARSARPAAAPSLPAPLPRPVDTAPRPPTVISLNTYSWEDKQSTVLVWVEVAEEAALREDSFNAQLLPESIKATVVGASGTSYRFAQRLYQPIDVAACKVRTSAAGPDSIFPRRRVKEAGAGEACASSLVRSEPAEGLEFSTSCLTLRVEDLQVRCQGKRMVFSLAKREPKSWLQLKEMKVVSLSKDGRLPTNEELRGTGIKRIA
jgi:hypothetical protein